MSEKESEEKIAQLQLLEQNMQNFLMQKQHLLPRQFLGPMRLQAQRLIQRCG